MNKQKITLYVLQIILALFILITVGNNILFNEPYVSVPGKRCPGHYVGEELVTVWYVLFSLALLNVISIVNKGK